MQSTTLNNTTNKHAVVPSDEIRTHQQGIHPKHRQDSKVMQASCLPDGV
jgi:hypothetical protein